MRARKEKMWRKEDNVYKFVALIEKNMKGKRGKKSRNVKGS
jgi:hypothetical protein